MHTSNGHDLSSLNGSTLIDLTTDAHAVGHVDPDESLMINPALKVIHTGDDEILVKHGSRSSFTRIVHDDGRTKLLGKLLRNMKSPTSLAHLRQHGIVGVLEEDNAIELLGVLRHEQIVVPAAQDVTHSYLAALMGADTHIGSMTVGVIGAGYLGSRVAQELARLGVGHLLVMDDRSTADEQLDKRHFALAPDSIHADRPYVESLQQHLAASGYHAVTAINAPALSADALRQAAAQADVLVVALEGFSSKLLHTVNAVMLETETPWMSLYIDGSEACVGPIYIPGESCCYNEFEMQHESTLVMLRDEYMTYKETVNAQGIGTPFILPPYLSVACGFAATALLRLLVSGQSFLVGRCMRIDFESLAVDYEEVMRLPRCPACSRMHSVYRNLYM